MEDKLFGMLPLPADDPDHVKDAFSGQGYIDYYIAKYCLSAGSSLADIHEAINRATDDGDVQAAFDMGVLCITDIDSEFYSIIDAYRYFEQAAINGHMGGLFQMGRKYIFGIGVEQSIDTAIKYYRRAADMGYPVAETALGQIYADRRYGVKDYAEAFRLFDSASTKGDPIAMTHLSDMYGLGMGIKADKRMASYIIAYAMQIRLPYNPADLDMSEMWCEIDRKPEVPESVAEHLTSGEDWRKKLSDDFNLKYENEIYLHDDLDYYLSEETIKSTDPEEQEKLEWVRWYLKSHKTPVLWPEMEWTVESEARAGDPVSLFKYALYRGYESGQFERLVEESARMGCAEAQVCMWRIIQGRENTGKSDGMEWLLKAVDAGEAEGLYEYGEYLMDECLDGNSDAQEDKIKILGIAMDHLDKAALGGAIGAMLKMGKIYDRGIDDLIEPDDEKAFYYYKMAADADDYRGYRYCGICYEEGRTAHQNFERAREMYDRAYCEQFCHKDWPDEEISFRLGRMLYHGLGGQADKERGKMLMEEAIREPFEYKRRSEEEVKLLMKKWGIKRLVLEEEDILYTWGFPDGMGD